MFKIESFVTPYILAYLGKYFKNFDPADFQMSLWGGGAVFQNLNLDLQVLDKELMLNLPVTFVSGHIHDLKISVPWTKLTSEPIQVSINTMALTMKLKPPSSQREEDTAASVSDTESSYSTNLTKSSYMEECVEDEDAPPPGYIQSLISKIWNNVQFKFENVIVKYAEEDVVLSFNINEASYCTVNQDWERAFIDLVYPDFILRKRFVFQDLTLCLDRTNNVGKIKAYQGPILYRCAFQIRIFKMFRSALSRTARFTRTEFHFDDMNFIISIEQARLLIKLYLQISSFYQTRPQQSIGSTCGYAPSCASTGGEKEKRHGKVTVRPTTLMMVDKEAEEGAVEETGEEKGGWGGWASWAMSWVPPASTFLGAEFEDDEKEESSVPSASEKPESVKSSEGAEPPTEVCHYHFYVNQYTVIFKDDDEKIRLGFELPNSSDLGDISIASEENRVPPLCVIQVIQPHMMCALTHHFQKFEMSVFSMSVKLRSSQMKTSWSSDQGLSSYLNLFDSILGEKDIKTGHVPPLFTFKVMDFMYKPCTIICDIKRPIKVEVSRLKLDTLIKLFGLLFDSGGSPLELKLASTKLLKTNSTEVLEQNRTRQHKFRAALGRIAGINISFSQLVFSLMEDLAVISLSCSSANINSTINTDLEKTDEAESWSGVVAIKSIAASTRLKERSYLLLTAFNASCELKCVWNSWLDYFPMLTMGTQLEPMTLHVGPHNILCLQQIHKTFKEYLDEVNLVEKEIVEIMEQEEPLGTNLIFDSFEDDLRAGSFKFVRVPSAFDLPQVYQIAFCDSQRTMTWRYPQFRVLTSVEASPVPIDYERNPSLKKTLDCIIEYWDCAMCDFRFFGKFTLSETSGASVRGTPIKDKLHIYNSDIWRIRILTPPEEADSIQLIRPEILAACLKVDSIHETSLVPKLKVFIEVPKITVQLVNNFYFAGRGPNEKLCQYSNKTVSQYDQIFATITLEANTLLVSVWMKHCSIDLMSYVEAKVLDYEFLTMTPVLEPSLVDSSFCLYDPGRPSNINSQGEIVLKQLTFKLGASALHTLISSWTLWAQLLGAWDGCRIRLREDLENLESINVNQILVLNTLSSEIRFQQSGAESSLFVAGGACVPFFWATSRHKPVCKLGLKDKDWAFDCSFDLNKRGYIVRNINRKPVFVHIENFSGMQRLVTVSGSLFVGNALHKHIEVAVLPTNKSVEERWLVNGHGYGSSQLLSLSEIDHFRFRIVTSSLSQEVQPWSGVITPDDFKTKSSSNGSICVQLFEEKWGGLETFCVWCSLVEETVEETTRFLIILSPYFRIQSFLPSETLVHVSTAKPRTNSVAYKLKGKGQQLELDFSGSHTTTHHLTLQSSPLGSSSSPSIPLLPEGPVIKIDKVTRPIDELLSKISGIQIGSGQEESVSSSSLENVWPFVSDRGSEKWNVCEQPKTDLGVEFTPWIQGLPTLLLKFRPWALVINLTGTELYFAQSAAEPHKVEQWDDYLIPTHSVYSPTKISFDIGRLKFGLKLNGELVWSEKLRLSEEKRRTDIHHVNNDSVLPVDSFGRLDLLSKEKSEIGYLTIETRLREKMLIITLRPTFTIMNKTPTLLFAQSLTISSTSPQTRGTWSDEKLSNYYTLTPQQEQGTPLLHFCTDGNEYVPSMRSVKYLAVSCGGPWWFLKLMDFSIIFDNMSSSQGVLAAAVSANIPKHGATYGASNTLLLEDSEYEAITLPVLVSWTSKNGQVWISITPEPCSQLVVHNSTGFPFVYVQSLGEQLIPVQETDYFEQYLVLPPNCRAHYAFPKKYMELLQISSSANYQLPNLLLAKLPQDLQDFMANFLFVVSGGCQSDVNLLKRTTNKPTPSPTQAAYKSPSGTLLIPGISLKWSNLLQLDGEASQYFSFGEYVDTKVSIEKVGFTFYVYIDNMSNVEVAAKDVRRRITTQSHISLPNTNPTTPSPTLPPHHPFPNFPNSFTSTTGSELEVSECVAKEDGCSPFEFHCYLPKLTVIVTDDMTSPMERKQLISFTLEDIVVEQIPRPDHTKYRALFDRKRGKFLRRECYVISGRVGDIQIDSPCCPCDLTCDFPVILKQVQHYQPTPVDRVPWKKYKDQSASSLEAEAMINLRLTFGQSSLNYKSMECVNVRIKPFFLNVEDRLLDHVLPCLKSILTVSSQQLEGMKKVARGRSCWVVEDGLEELYPLHELESSCTELEVGGCGGMEGECEGSVEVCGEIKELLENFASPILLESLLIEECEVCLSVRIAKLVYLAVDHSKVKMPEFGGRACMTTSYHLGQALSAHYTTGAIFQIGNPMRLIGSLELLGSPGSLVGSVGTGLRDFVLYPYQGIFQGPTGFISGLGNGVTSLLKSITSGALTSVTNWAWSMSRNIDKLTLDEEEQYLTEAGRRVPLEGFSHGLLQGLTGFGIRLLGAIGGIAHHPIQNVIQRGASPGAVLQGVSRGVVGMVTRPIGGLAELVAMTGQGVLRSAGWSPHLEPKGSGERLIEDISNCPNSLLKYQLALALFPKGEEQLGEQRFVLLIDAVQPNSLHTSPAKLKPISLLLSNRNLYLIDIGEDIAVSHFPISLLNSQPNQDRNLICLKTAPPKDFAKERMLDFVSTLPTSPSNNSWEVLPATPPSSEQEGSSTCGGERLCTVISSSSGEGADSLCPLFMTARMDGSMLGEEMVIGHYVVSPHEKAEFESVLEWLKGNLDNRLFYVDI